MALNDSVTTTKNTGVTIKVLANDRDPDGFLVLASVTIVAQPIHGKVTVNPKTGLITYVPTKNYVGSDRFTYKVKDNSGAYSNVASVVLKVTPPKLSSQAGLSSDWVTNGMIDPVTRKAKKT